MSSPPIPHDPNPPPSPPSSPSRSPSPSAPLLDHDHRRLQREHHTLGYRDGITAGKQTHLQAGFDEGYSLGSRFGLKIGYIQGTISGFEVVARKLGGGWEERVQSVKKRAETELRIENVLGRDWFDENGVWKYNIEEEKKEEGVTFDRVVEKHPVVGRWVREVWSIAEELGLQVREVGETI
ncbi:Essential protein Yae1, N terminal [Rhizina undulata]